MKKITRKIKNFFLQIKWFFQRGFKGYCDKDIWSLRDWFIAIFPEMLREMAIDLHSSPAEINASDWQDILNRMAISLERTDAEYWLDRIKEGKVDDFNFPNYGAEIKVYKDIFMDMFSKYFFDLWN